MHSPTIKKDGRRCAIGTIPHRFQMLEHFLQPRHRLPLCQPDFVPTTKKADSDYMCLVATLSSTSRFTKRKSPSLRAALRYLQRLSERYSSKPQRKLFCISLIPRNESETEIRTSPATPMFVAEHFRPFAQLRPSTIFLSNM
jgi:hypothetical protein